MNNHTNIQISQIIPGYRSNEGIWVKGVNSAQFCGVNFEYKNTSTKTIKYISFLLVAINRVGDILDPNKPTARIKCTGPIEPDHSDKCYNEITWQDAAAIDSVKLESIEIEYMDGTSETISGDDINPSGGKVYIYGYKQWFLIDCDVTVIVTKDGKEGKIVGTVSSADKTPEPLIIDIAENCAIGLKCGLRSPAIIPVECLNTTLIEVSLPRFSNSVKAIVNIN